MNKTNESTFRTLISLEAEAKCFIRIYVGAKLERNVGRNERITFAVQIFSNITRTVAKKPPGKVRSARDDVARFIAPYEKPTDFASRSISSHARKSDNPTLSDGIDVARRLAPAVTKLYHAVGKGLGSRRRGLLRDHRPERGVEYGMKRRPLLRMGQSRYRKYAMTAARRSCLSSVSPQYCAEKAVLKLIETLRCTTGWAVVQIVWRDPRTRVRRYRFASPDMGFGSSEWTILPR